MTKTKKDAPTIATFADHEVITPPNRLQKAVAYHAPAGDDPVGRAEKALATLSTEFSAWMSAEIERLDAARRQVHAVGFTSATREALFHAAHDIKGAAPTFGFPAVAGIAESLCRLIEHTPDLTRIPALLLDQHVDAVRAIMRECARNDTTEVTAALTKRLRDVTDDFLLRENEHRPDYLDGIVAPSLAPKG
jgi:HPt (histidine-containing phosphotransfer) domain-containing protein